MKTECLLEALANAILKPELGVSKVYWAILRRRKIVVVSKDRVLITDKKIASFTPMEFAEGLNTEGWDRFFCRLQEANDRGEIE